MTIKVTMPLYAGSASGHIKKVGTFRMSGARAVVIEKPTGNRTPVIKNAQLKYKFRKAKALHHALPVHLHIDGGKKHHRREPRWPDFWRAYLIAHPLVTDVSAHLAASQGAQTLNAHATLHAGNDLHARFDTYQLEPITRRNPRRFRPGARLYIIEPEIYWETQQGQGEDRLVCRALRTPISGKLSAQGESQSLNAHE